jgi:hypothetical protein
MAFGIARSFSPDHHDEAFPISPLSHFLNPLSLPKGFYGGRRFWWRIEVERIEDVLLVAGGRERADEGSLVGVGLAAR